MSPAPRRPPDWLVNQLPVGMTDDDFLVRFVRIIEAVAGTVMHQVDNLPHLFDVSVAPDVMVRAMGSWCGLDWVDPSLPDATQRAMVGTYSRNLMWRGTNRGLRELLEVITDGPVTINDSGGVYTEGNSPQRPAHVVIRCASTGWVTAKDLERVIRAELPAMTTFDVIIEEPEPQQQPPAETVSGR